MAKKKTKKSPAGSRKPAPPVTPKKKTAVVQQKPKPKATAPTPEPAKPVQPWSTQGREARAKELAAMSPEEKAKEKESSMRRMGFRPQEPGVMDRLKTAWKVFKAKPDEKVSGAERTWRSVFSEIAQFLEEQNLVGQVTLSEMMDIMGDDAKAVLSENHTVNEWFTLLSESGLFLEEETEENDTEKYTLEEWIGMVEEAGYNISEQDPPAKPSTTTTPSRRDRFGPQSARDIADRDAATDAYRSGAVSPGASSIYQAASDIAGTRFPPTSLGAIASTLARTARGGGLAPKAAEPRYRGPSDEPNRPGETPGQRLDRDLRAAARDPGGAAHRATVAAMTAAERPRISADAEREAGKRMQHVRAINRALTPGVINRARDLGLPVPGFDALPVTAADSGNVARRLTQQGIDSTANAIQQRLSRLKEQDDKKNPYPRRIPDWQRDALLNDPEGTAADQALSTPSLDALDGAMRNVRTMNAMRRAAINSANADVLAGVGTDDGYSNRLRRTLANKIDLQNRLADRAAALKAAGRDADELPRVANPIEPWDVPRGLKKAPQIPDVPNSPINENTVSRLQQLAGIQPNK